MKKSLQATIAILTAFLLLPLTAYAAFNDVTMSDGSSQISLTDLGLNYLIEASTRVESFNVGTGNVSFTVSANSIISLKSVDKSGFTVTGNGCDSATITCDSDASRLLILCGGTVSNHTLTVTPGAANTCSPGGSSGGGSGGGGGGGGFPATPATPATPAVPNPGQGPATPAIPATPAVPAHVRFSTELRKGSTGADVTALQQQLLDLGFFPKSVAINGIFGPTTMKSLQAFQKANHIPPTGKVDAATQDALNGEVTSAPAPSTPSGTPNSHTFMHNLGAGSHGKEVQELQEKLKELGFFPLGTTPNGIFGPATIKAVKAFQKANGLSQVGAIGPQSRSLLNNQ